MTLVAPDRLETGAGKPEPRSFDILKPVRWMSRRVRRLLRGRAPVPTTEGFVDRILAGEILGWAFDPTKPNRRVHVVVRCDGEVVAEALADLPRKDLIRDAKGDGRHGFNLRLPGRLLDGQPRRLRVEASSDKGPILLRGGMLELSGARPTSPGPAVPAPAGPGALERIANGMLVGWAVSLKAGNGPAVVDVYDDERYLGSVHADRPRPRLQEALPGARGFQFKLPADADEALHGRLRARIAGTNLDLERADSLQLAPPRQRAPDLVGESAGAKGSSVGLLVVGDGSPDAIRRTTRSWTEQIWRDVRIGRLTSAAEAATSNGEHVFGPGDLPRLQAFADDCAVVAIVRPGETLDPGAAKALMTAKPGAGALTWDLTDQDGGLPMRRRSEAWPLAILLGGSLGGGYAVRRAALAPILGDLIEAGAAGGLRGFELALARAPSVRWAHLPAALSACRRDLARPPRLAAEPAAERAGSVTLAIWPRWNAASARTLASFGARLGGADLEVLAPASATREVKDALRAAGVRRGRVEVAAIETPSGDGAGTWLRALGDAASADAVLFCRAGLEIEAGDVALLADWAMSPLVGAVTGEVETGVHVLAGFTVTPSRTGWRIVSAFDPARQGLSRPVLAAPGAFLTVARSKLAAVRGFDAERFAGVGAGFDLGMRLRRMGWANMVAGGARARHETPLLRRELSALAQYDVAELAAAAAAYPIPEAAKARTGETT